MVWMVDLRKQFITVDEVMKALELGRTKSYGIIKALNDELEAKGFRTISGRVPRSYFCQRYGLEMTK